MPGKERVREPKERHRMCGPVRERMRAEREAGKRALDHHHGIGLSPKKNLLRSSAISADRTAGIQKRVKFRSQSYISYFIIIHTYKYMRPGSSTSRGWLSPFR